MRQSISTLVVVVTLVAATAGLAMAPAAATGPDVFAQDDGMNETETMSDGDSMDDDGMNETETMSDGDSMDDDGMNETETMDGGDDMEGEENMDEGGLLPVSTGVGIAGALVVLGAGGVAALRLR